MGDKVVIHDIEIWKFAVFLFHFTVQMLTQFDSVVFASRPEHRLCCLSGSRSYLQYSFSGSDLCLFIQKREELFTVPRTEFIKLLRYRIEDSTEFVLL